MSPAHRSAATDIHARTLELNRAWAHVWAQTPNEFPNTDHHTALDGTYSPRPPPFVGALDS